MPIANTATTVITSIFYSFSLVDTHKVCMLLYKLNPGFFLDVYRRVLGPLRAQALGPFTNNAHNKSPSREPTRDC